MLDLFQQMKDYITIFYNFSALKWHRLLKSFLMDEKDQPFLQSQYLPGANELIASKSSLHI